MDEPTVQGVAPGLGEPNSDLELEHIDEHSRCQLLADLSRKETLESQPVMFVWDDDLPVARQEVVGWPQLRGQDRHELLQLNGELLQLNGGFAPGGGDVTFQLGKGSGIGGSDMLVRSALIFQCMC